MTDREKLVELINHVSEGHIVNLMQPGGVEELADYLIAHGVTVKQMQRPLTLEEVHELKAVWIEDPFEDYDMPLYPAIYWGKGNFTYSVFIANIDDGEEKAWCDNETYGYDWRCWAEKPTEEERKAAKWL